MLTGERAFKGEDISDTLAAVLRQDIPLSALPATTPGRLTHLIGRCLERDPKQRLRDIGEARIAIAGAERELAQGPSVASTDVAPVSARPRPLPRVVAATVVATTVLTIAGGWAVMYIRRTPPVEERAIHLSLDPPEGGQFVFGGGGGIARSPDGRAAAYVASVSGKTGLCVKRLDRSPAQLLPGTGNAAFPFWSPDRRSIAFFARAKLWRVDQTGGSPQSICDAPDGRGGAWTTDHRILFGALARGLSEVRDSGGTRSPLTTLDTSRGEVAHRWPQVLPGGRLLYWVQSAKSEVQGIYAASLAKPTDGAQLVSADANGRYAPAGDGRGYLLWLRGGKLMAQQLDPATSAPTGESHEIADPVTSSGASTQMNVTASAGGLLLYSAFDTKTQFALIDRATGERLKTIGEPAEYGMFRLSPNQLHIATSQIRPGGDSLWLIEVERGVATPFTSTPGTSGFPIWSPNSRTIVYYLLPSRNLFRRDAGGAGTDQRLTESLDVQFATDWSRDGRSILYGNFAAGGQPDLWVLPMTPEGTVAAGAKARPYMLTPELEWLGRFSPEEPPSRVAYQSNKSGQTEVYIDSFPQPHGAMQISKGGGTCPQWGAEGRELFYVSPDFKLMVVRLKPTGDSVEPSVPQELFPLPSVDNGLCPYDTSRDGKRFLVRATPEHGASPSLTVIVNWSALLNKEAPAP
jgi:hypothetical protein